LIDDILILSESKSFDDLSLNTFLITIAWGGCETYAEFLVDEGCEGSRGFESGPVRLIYEDQRVVFRLKATPDVVFDHVLALG